MQKKIYSLVALMMIFNTNDPPSDVICWIYMFERIRCMDGGIVLREVVIIHTVWISITRRYLPEEKHQMTTRSLVQNLKFANFEFAVYYKKY